MTQAIAAFGTLLQMGNGASPEVFVNVAEVTEIGGPNLSLDTADATAHESPGRWEEVVPTILRSGEITLALNYVPAGATHGYSTGLLRDMVARIKRNYKLVFPNIGATTWSFAAYVVKFSTKEPVADKLGADVSLKITGQPSLA